MLGWVGRGAIQLPPSPSLPTSGGAAAVRDNQEETRGSSYAFLRETCRHDEAAVPRGKAGVACVCVRTLSF